MSSAKLPPGPRGLPWFGQALGFTLDPFSFFDRFLPYAPISHHKTMGTHFFMLMAPEPIEHVLVKNYRNYQKDLWLRSWKRVFGEGLLTSEGDPWKKERQLIGPLFTRDRVAAYSRSMTEHARTSVLQIAKGDLNQPIDLRPHLTDLTLDIVVDLLFGASLGEVKAQVCEAFAECTRFFEETQKPWGMFLTRFPVLPGAARYERAVQTLEQIIIEIIARRRKEKTERDDLLSALLSVRDEHGHPMEDQRVRDELMTFFLAGHETTALTITSTLWILGQYTQVQTQLRGEDSERLLEQVIMESQRLYPPVWVMARESLKEDHVCGFTIPPGSHVVIPNRTLQRDPRWFAEPEAFKPERWTEEFKSSLPRAVYMPFGFGPRMCVGSIFAMQEIKIILKEWLLAFEIRTMDPTPPKLQASITARPLYPVWVDLKARPTDI